MPVLTLLSPGRVYEGRRLREPGREAVVSCGGIVAGAGRATPTKVSLLDPSSCNPSPAQGYQCCVFEASCGSRVS
jgi:hypothetical protein